MGFLTIIEKGLQESPPPKREPRQKRRARNSQERNLLPRIQKHKEAALRFYLDYVDLEAPFENHQAESDLRMLKVLLEAAGCFRTVKSGAGFSPSSDSGDF
jgi:hypothetical protein